MYIYIYVHICMNMSASGICMNISAPNMNISAPNRCMNIAASDSPPCNENVSCQKQHLSSSILIS